MVSERYFPFTMRWWCHGHSKVMLSESLASVPVHAAGSCSTNARLFGSNTTRSGLFCARIIALLNMFQDSKRLKTKSILAPSLAPRVDLIWQTPWNGEEELKELNMPSILSELWGLNILHSARLLLPFEPGDLASRSEPCTNRSLFVGLGCFIPTENFAIAPILLVAPKREYFLTIGNLAYPSMSPVQRSLCGRSQALLQTITNSDP